MVCWFGVFGWFAAAVCLVLLLLMFRVCVLGFIC